MAFPEPRKLVLVVEDEPDIARPLCDILEFYNYETAHAADGEKALVFVKERRPDLIVLDIMMPKMDGWEVCRRLKGDPETRDIPVVIYTALSQSKDIEKARALGADNYITKDKDIRQVVQSIRRFFGD